MLNFTAIDFETGKYSPESAVSVGLVKFADGEAVDSFYTLLRPPSLYIRPDFTRIHGLTVDDVRDAPRFPEILEQFLRFIDGDLLAAHNAEFDMGVLRAVLEFYNLAKPELEYFCTLNLSRRAWPGLHSHALTALGKNFDISYEAHNALADARTCGRIACLAAEKFHCLSAPELLSAAGLGGPAFL